MGLGQLWQGSYNRRIVTDISMSDLTRGRRES
jgi:hypothetical protein